MAILIGNLQKFCRFHKSQFHIPVLIMLYIVLIPNVHVDNISRIIF